MQNNTQSFASRELIFKTEDGANRIITISVFVPRQIENGWECDIEIANLSDEGDLEKGKVAGVDSFQAALHGLEQAAMLIYTSDTHKSGRLTWLGEEGYGLPLISNFSDLARKLVPMQILHVI